MSKADVVFVLGGPGAGKGTQCGKLVANFGFVHLSAGDLLRAERKKETETATLIANYIKQGAIVPVEITIGLLKKAMEENVKEGRSKFLVDGFPRNRDNYQGWEKIMGEYADVRFLLFLECPEEVMQQRLLGRNEGRTDDNLESIKKRFKTYETETMPIVQIFEKQGKVRKVIADRSVEEVYADVSAHFAKAFGTAATTEEEVESEREDPRKIFNKGLVEAMRQLSVEDVEEKAAEKEKKGEKEKETKKFQYWFLPVEKQKALCEKVVRATIFDPDNPTSASTKSTAWSVSVAGMFSLSGGLTVTCKEEKLDGSFIHHTAYVNYYGVLESYETPLNLPQKTLLPAQLTGEGEGCTVM